MGPNQVKIGLILMLVGGLTAGAWAKSAKAPSMKSKALPKPKRFKELTDALIDNESSGRDVAIGDRNLREPAYGPLQIREPVCVDVNRCYGTHYRATMMQGNRALSLKVFWLYMKMYATRKALGREPTNQDRARIWNGGPNGWKRSTTIDYWEQRIKPRLLRP